MFGRDELNMQFPKMFIDYLYHFYGLVLGIEGKVQPYIEEAALPLDLAKLYNMNIIDYPAFYTESFSQSGNRLPADTTAYH